MGEKSEQKRKLIIERARGVFAEKGYKAVTMKDIVEACGISRGGLYLYFSSTRELFETVLKDDSGAEDDEDQALSRAIDEESSGSASDLLALFIKAQKKEVFRKRGNLTIASYEYFSEIAGDEGENALRTQFDTAVMIASHLIEDGVRTGEFICADPGGFARNLMYVVEGMKVSSQTMGVSEPEFDREIVYVLQQLVPEE